MGVSLASWFSKLMRIILRILIRLCLAPLLTSGIALTMLTSHALNFLFVEGLQCKYLVTQNNLK